MRNRTHDQHSPSEINIMREKAINKALTGRASELNDAEMDILNDFVPWGPDGAFRREIQAKQIANEYRRAKRNQEEERADLIILSCDRIYNGPPDGISARRNAFRDAVMGRFDSYGHFVKMKEDDPKRLEYEEKYARYFMRFVGQHMTCRPWVSSPGLSDEEKAAEQEDSRQLSAGLVNSRPAKDLTTRQNAFRDAAMGQFDRDYHFRRMPEEDPDRKSYEAWHRKYFQHFYDTTPYDLMLKFWKENPK